MQTVGCTPSLAKRNGSAANVQGFTLIELMIVVVIIAILASIALPAYDSYLKKSRAKAASADLAALGLNFENAYQRKLAYPTSDSDIAAAKSGWAPTQTDFFTYSEETTATTYTLTATGKNGSSGCNISLTNDNTRTIEGGTACGGLTKW